MCFWTACEIIVPAVGLAVLREAAAAHRPPPPNEDWRRPDAQGRVRSFAPEEGSYASSVMVPGAWADRRTGWWAVGRASAGLDTDGA